MEERVAGLGVAEFGPRRGLSSAEARQHAGSEKLEKTVGRKPFAAFFLCR